MRHLNIHILRTTTISNLNRERNGSPKTAPVGGVLRNRLSSQSIKRAIRIGYETAIDGDRTTRTKLFHEANIATHILNELTNAGVDITETVDANIDAGLLPDTLRSSYKPMKATKKKVTAHVELDLPVKAAVTLLLQLYLDQLVANAETCGKKYTANLEALRKGQNLTVAVPTDSDTDDTSPADDEAGDTLVWLAETEINGFAAPILGQFLGEDHTTVEQFDMLETDRTRSLTIAAFGRMFASRPDLQTRATIQVNHAFGTHPYTTTPDYYTAVDDLRLSLHGDAGAGHIAQAEYTSATLYSHLTVDMDELAARWDAPDDPAERTRRLAAFYREIFLALPNGKTNTTAPINLPDHITIMPSTRRGSLATAFQTPVRPNADTNGGYITPSIDQLRNYIANICRFAPSLYGPTLEADIYHGNGATLDELVNHCVTLTEQAIATRQAKDKDAA